MVYVLLALEAGVWRSVYSCLWKPCANRACAILEELLHYREVFTSTKRTMYSCFPHLDVLHSKWMACTACTAAAATSPLLPQFCLYPPPPSSNLSASHSHTHRCTYCTRQDLHPPAAVRPSWPCLHLHTHLHVLEWLHPTKLWWQRLSYHQRLPAENISSYV